MCQAGVSCADRVGTEGAGVAPGNDTALPVKGREGRGVFGQGRGYFSSIFPTRLIASASILASLSQNFWNSGASR